MIALGTLFLFSFVTFSQPKHKFQKKHFKTNMIEKLNLTDEQKESISDLKSAHQKEMIDLKADLQKKMIDMKETRKDPKLSREKLISAVEEINTIKNKIAISRVNHGMDVYELLNDEQKKIWQEHKPFKEHFKMKFKERGFGHGEFGFNELNTEPYLDKNESAE